MNKRPRTSFELTEITAAILKDLKLARWDYTEVLNAGIVAFSQMDKDQKMFFREIAYGLKPEAKAKVLAEEQFYTFVCLQTRFDTPSAGKEKRQKLLKSIKTSTTLPDDRKKLLCLLIHQLEEALQGKKQIPSAGFLELG